MIFSRFDFFFFILSFVFFIRSLPQTFIHFIPCGIELLHRHLNISLDIYFFHFSYLRIHKWIARFWWYLMDSRIFFENMKKIYNFKTNIFDGKRSHFASNRNGAFFSLRSLFSSISFVFFCYFCCWEYRMLS